MPQRVKKRPDTPLDLETFFDGIRMETRRNGFCSVNVELARIYLESNELPAKVSTIREHSFRNSLTAVVTESNVVFRKLMKPMEDVTEVLRASGDAVCEICHYAYKYHPEDTSPNDFLKVLCCGRRVKL